MRGRFEMTKQQAQQSAASEAITPQSLLHRYKLYNEIVEKYRTKNISANLDMKRVNDYTPQLKLKGQERLEEFIKSTTHPKTGQFISSDYLLDQGVLSSQDVEQFEHSLPYARLNRLTHVKTPDGKEWLERMFTLFCLDRSGNVVHRVLTNHDYFHMPVVQHMSVSEDPEDRSRDGKQLHVDIIKDDIWMEPTGKKVQLLEYNESSVNQILKDIPPVGSFSDVVNGCSLTLQKVGEIHDLIAVKSIEEYLEPFDQIWAKKRSVPGASVDVKSLIKEMREQSLTENQTEAYQ
jgi:hypothetical protein